MGGIICFTQRVDYGNHRVNWWTCPSGDRFDLGGGLLEEGDSRPCGAPAARPGAATAALSDISKWDDHWQSVLMLYVLGPGPPG